jgi:hypothetical protein
VRSDTDCGSSNFRAQKTRVGTIIYTMEPRHLCSENPDDSVIAVAPATTQWAAGLLGLLGIAFSLFGGILLLTAMAAGARLFILLYSLLLLTPGVAYTVLAWFLLRRERWAATAGLAVVVMQMLTATALTAVSMIYLPLGLFEWVLLGLWMASLVLAGVWLMRCRRMPGTRRGFEALIPAQPLDRITPSQRNAH